MQPFLKNRRFVLAFVGGALVGGTLAYSLLSSSNTRIVLTHVPENASIYLDNDLHHDEGGRVVLKDVTPGQHTLLVAADGFWPWAKTIEIEDDSTLDFGVLALWIKPELHTGTVTMENPEAAKVSMASLPTSEEPAVSADRNVHIWMDENVIYAAWQGREGKRPAYYCNPTCSNTLTVFNSDVPIRSLSFFGERSDAILFAAENGIFALELDTRGTQNFQPLYLGTAPIFSLGDDSVLVYDGNDNESFFAVELH